MDFISIEKAKLKMQRDEERARMKQNHVGSLLDEEALAYIAEYFEVNKCAFRGDAGGYDPMDAMKRDAHREFFLRLREWRRNWKKANN